MNEPIEVSSLVDYINQINIITDSEKGYLYRGQRNAAWQVNSSAYRRLEISTNPSEQESEKEYDRSPELLRFQHRAYLVQIVNEIQLKYPSTYKGMSGLECMAHLQHNKVATGLIDFTFSPLVALWFACNEETDEDTNGKVIVLENDSEKIEEIRTIEVLGRDLEAFFDVDQEQWYRWAPTLDSRTVDTERMTIQQSVFLFGLPEINGGLSTQGIIIPAEHKESLKTELEKMGISEKTLFSDLLGFFERNTSEHSYDRTLVEPYYGERLP